MRENHNALSSGVARYGHVQESLRGRRCWTASLFNI